MAALDAGMVAASAAAAVSSIAGEYVYITRIVLHAKTNLTGRQGGRRLLPELISPRPPRAPAIERELASPSAPMQQRRVASGRPSGTDGSDFSYRMVVDSRYQRVAEGRSRLARLILVQVLHHVAGGALLLLSLSKGAEANKFAVLSVAAGLLAIVLGELGRRWTMAVLLRLYTSLSSIAVAFSVTCIIRSELLLKVMKQNTAAITSYELFDGVRVALGVLLQMVVIATTTRLLQNMSPPKRAS